MEPALMEIQTLLTRSQELVAQAVDPRAQPTQRADALSAVRQLLQRGLQQLAGGVPAEGEGQEKRESPDEPANLIALADLGELAGPLTHEFGNYVNVVQLQLAILDPEAPDSLRQELAKIYRQGKAVAALIRQWQQDPRQKATSFEPIDLNAAVRATVQTLAGPSASTDRPLLLLAGQEEATGSAEPRAGVSVSLTLASNLPPVLGHLADLRRLCTFLVTNAAGASGPGGRGLTVRTESSGNRVLLGVDDWGPAVEPARLSKMFEPQVALRPGTNSLELAACERLTRRLRGKIEAVNRPEGGVTITVALSAAAPPTGSPSPATF